MCNPQKSNMSVPAAHVECAANFLFDVAGGKPEEHVHEPHSHSPDVNTMVLLDDLLTLLTDMARDATSSDNEELHDQAMSDRDDLIVVFATALRSTSYAAMLWEALTARSGSMPA